MNTSTLPPLPIIDGYPFHSGPVLLLDNSTLDSFIECPRQYEYAHLYKRISAGNKSPLNFGGAIHLALAHRYRTGSNEVSDILQAEQAAILSAHFSNNPQPMEEFRSPTHAERMIVAYNQVYKNEPFKVLTNPKTGELCVEQSVLHYLGEVKTGKAFFTPNDVENGGQTTTLETLPIYYTGRIDLIISDSAGTWVLDHKTTFQFGTGLTDEMSTTAQMKGYCWAYLQTFGELPTGYIINAIRVRKPTKAEELAEVYIRTSGNDPDFARLPFYISEDDIAEWKHNTLAIVQNIIHLHSINYLPMNRKWCRGKYGRCQFFEVCTCHRDSRSAILTSEAFADNVWSPLNKPTVNNNNTGEKTV